jgi:ribosome-associated protein
MLTLTPLIALSLDEIELTAARSQGAGGQHVNKTSTAIQLRFDIHASTLPEDWKARLLQRRDRRISDDGIVVIKAQQFRSQEQNRTDAIERLRELLLTSAEAPKRRRATKPTLASRRQRLDDKKRLSRVKALRSKPDE